MATNRHKFVVSDARRVKHPVFPNIEKHYMLVRCSDIPGGISMDPNARDPEGMNRAVYREVKKSLYGDGTEPGSFDLMNKGIVILADSVRRISDHEYEIIIRQGQGIVDGGHTYRLITESREKEALPDEQHVEVQIRTGVRAELITDISRGLNTGIAVKAHSIANLDGKYDWLKKELQGQPYFNLIAWKESDKGDYDIRDLICVMEAMNVFDFPNDKSRHPVQAYEKWSVPTKRFSDDYDAHEKDITKSKYFRLRPILRDALVLFDTIRAQFRDIYNQADLGAAGKLDIVEEAKGKRELHFPFANLPPSKYRLTKGALYPIFAAFRNKVILDSKTGNACWDGGFESVIELWQEVGPELAAQTKQATKDYGHKPDVLGKNRGHWTNMHQTVELRILREAMKASKGKAA